MGIKLPPSKFKFRAYGNLLSEVKKKMAKGDIPFASFQEVSYKAWNEMKSKDAAAKDKKRRYWWLVASPKIWRLSDLDVGAVESYTLYNESGNQRRVFQNFLDARVGDIVVGYEATPLKAVVAILEVARENDGKNIWFRKTKAIDKPATYETLKKDARLQNMEFFANPNGSLFKMTKEEYDTVMGYVENQPYTKDDFLREVYVSSDDYEKIKSLLKRKKNLILQGAPGVGKTFAAERIAYAMMGLKDKNRIKKVQFHQSYSYEDFIMGYKPTPEGGFDMRHGVFYEFCKHAEADKEHNYFFIIDEINRGNMSKIFGELLMLIENNYRDEPITLPYGDEPFSVPENLYIIGMMNTADRSLAMIDYALRRRFCFFPMKPGFDSEGFKNSVAKIGNTKLEKAVEAVKALNVRIAQDSSLGSGFCIGHSYFCGEDLEHCDDQKISEIVEYDIIPQLREYWFDNEDVFNKEADELKKALK